MIICCIIHNFPFEVNELNHETVIQWRKISIKWQYGNLTIQNFICIYIVLLNI